MVDGPDKKEDSFEFDAAGEAVEYVSLDQARLVAVQAAREVPGNYGPSYEDARMVFDLVEQEEREDYYVITLSFRPEGNFNGTPGREQYFIEKEGNVADRQVLALPGRRRLPVVPILIGLTAVVVVAIGAVVSSNRLFDSGSTGESTEPLAATLPTALTPIPTPRAAPQQTTETVVTTTPSPTNKPVVVPVPVRTLAPASSSVPTPAPTSFSVPQRPLIATAGRNQVNVMSHGFPGDGRLASLSEGLYAVAINVHLEEGHEADLWLQVLDAECINSLGFGDGDYVDRGSLDSGDSSHLLTWAASATELQTAHDAGGICVVSVALERPDPGETKWHILARETIGSFLPDVTRTTQPGQSSPVPSPVIVSTPLLPTATAVVKLLPTATAVATEVANVAAEPPALGDGRTPLATTPWTEVSQTEVRFWFPVESPDSIWVWNRPETRDLVLEYSWAVIFEVSDAYFALAVKNFKSPNGMRGEGRLTDLLDAAQVNVWRLNQPESSSLVAGYVTARVSGEGILFTLYDPELVTWFVEDPPDVVIFETKGSALDFSTQTVSVR